MKLHLFNGVEQSDEMLPTDDKTETKEMKEGDYLRQRVSAADEEDEDDKSSTGCLKLRNHSSSSPDCPSPRRARSVSEDTGAAHHSKIAEKLLRILHYHSEDHSGGGTDTGRRSSSRTACQAADVQPRRRYLRVVKDADAPPPECIGDNPNLICRYSQEFLRDHYHRKRHATGDNEPQPTLPYVTSGHTILKKSSTDPTCMTSGSTSDGMKHATFSDVVTVVETVNGTTHEEQLHDNSSVEDVSEGLESVSEEPLHANEFYLTDDTIDGPDNVDSVPVFEAAAVISVETDLSHADLGKTPTKDSAAFMSVLSSTAQPEESTGIASEAKPRRLPTTTKRVDLAELMAQLRSNDLNSRADRDST